MKQFIINIGDNWDKSLPLKIEWAFSIPIFEETTDYIIDGNQITYNIELDDTTIGFYVILKVSQNDNVIYREYHTIN
jgi:hypothetical protein